MSSLHILLQEVKECVIHASNICHHRCNQTGDDVTRLELCFLRVSGDSVHRFLSIPESVRLNNIYCNRPFNIFITKLINFWKSFLLQKFMKSAYHC